MENWNRNSWKPWMDPDQSLVPLIGPHTPGAARPGKNLKEVCPPAVWKRMRRSLFELCRWGFTHNAPPTYRALLWEIHSIGCDPRALPGGLPPGLRRAVVSSLSAYALSRGGHALSALNRRWVLQDVVGVHSASRRTGHHPLPCSSRPATCIS